MISYGTFCLSGKNYCIFKSILYFVLIMFCIDFFQPPMVRCNTRIWHPNINEDGEVCLSLLRQTSMDSMGKIT